MALTNMVLIFIIIEINIVGISETKVLPHSSLITSRLEGRS